MLLPLEQTGLPKDPQVVRNRRLVEARRPVPSATWMPLSVREDLEHGQSLRIAHRLEHPNEVQLQRHGRVDGTDTVRRAHTHPPTRQFDERRTDSTVDSMTLIKPSFLRVRSKTQWAVLAATCSPTGPVGPAELSINLPVLTATLGGQATR